MIGDVVSSSLARPKQFSHHPATVGYGMLKRTLQNTLLNMHGQWEGTAAVAVCPTPGALAALGLRLYYPFLGLFPPFFDSYTDGHGSALNDISPSLQPPQTVPRTFSALL